jgi:hypothetical protein
LLQFLEFHEFLRRNCGSTPLKDKLLPLPLLLLLLLVGNINRGHDAAGMLSDLAFPLLGLNLRSSGRTKWRLLLRSIMMRRFSEDWHHAL